MPPQAANFYAEMTNYELSELAMSMQANNAASIAIYISVLFAYLAAAYFVGKQLTKFQLYSLSFIYSVFMINVMFGLFSLGRDQLILVLYITNVDGTLTFYVSMALLAITWIVSLVFMHQSRNDT